MPFLLSSGQKSMHASHSHACELGGRRLLRLVSSALRWPSPQHSSCSQAWTSGLLPPEAIGIIMAALATCMHLAKTAAGLGYI